MTATNVRRRDRVYPVRFNPRDVFPNRPGVYRVVYEDHGGDSFDVAGQPWFAYFDGIDTWSYPTTIAVETAYRQRMAPGRHYCWAALPPN